MNVGIVGTSSIAQTMIGEFQSTSTFRCTAICSRSGARGREAADRYAIETVYTDYARMLADPAVEMVYIAAPNSLHYDYAMAALTAGKHVLCEKPFVPTLAQADALYRLAKERGLLLLETITTAYHPNYARARAALAQIGDVMGVSCVFCQRSSRYQALLEGQVFPVFSPAFCGGALMDINLYNVHFVVGLFGEPQAVHYYPHLHENGIDTNGVLVLEYPGFLCTCTGAKDSAGGNSAEIRGSRGRIEIRPGSSNCQELEVLCGGDARRTAEDGSPWKYEVLGLERIVAKMDFDACDRAFAVTRSVVKVLEAARKDAGLSY